MGLELALPPGEKADILTGMNTSAKDLFSRCRQIFSQEQLAEELGKTVRTIRRWEKGQGRIPDIAVPALRALLKGDLRVMEDSPVYGSQSSGEFSFIDLFAGIGGTRQAFESVGGKCVFTSEWDRFACQTYRANYCDEHEIAGDITKVHTDQIPDHDVLVAGFPCQPFSLAGVSKKNSLGRSHGFKDQTQGTLFFDIVRILEARRPRAFLLENVKHLRRHDQGRTFEVIMRTLQQELGYQVSERVVNAASFVPQSRERIFIVGSREPMGFDWDSIVIPPVDVGPKLESILHHSEEAPEGHFTEIRRKKCRVADRYTLTDHLWTYLQNYAEKHAAKGNGFGCSVFGPKDVARTLSARYFKDGSEILIKQARKNPRRLTPRECARLMGFPDTFKIQVSDTQAYKQFGNSVVVPVVAAVAEGISSCLKGTPLPVRSLGEQLRLAV